MPYEKPWMEKQEFQCDNDVVTLSGGDSDDYHVEGEGGDDSKDTGGTVW